MLKRTLHWLFVHRAAIAWVLLVLYVSALFAKENEDRNAARFSNCVQRQALYDGEIFIPTFIGQKLGASPAQIKAGIGDLVDNHLHARPVCSK